jgi:hypothetical protein
MSAPPAGFEPATFAFVRGVLYPLSYGGVAAFAAAASDARTQPAPRGSATQAGEDAAARRPGAASGVRGRGEGTPNMQGGQKGLFVNSTNLCLAKHRARVNATGQNGRRELSKPIMRAQKCGKAHRKRHKGHRRKAKHKRGNRR